MATTLTLYANADTTDSPLLTSGVDWVAIDVDLDFLVVSGGSPSVADGQPLPTSSELNQAGVVLTGSEIVVDKYFLGDFSADLLKKIDNMGEGNFRYVLAFDFTGGGTASEPVLELWDNSSLDTVANTSLGAGTASSSWWRGITTTDGLPGASWVGSRLAGSGDGNFLWLNNLNGPLASAETLYCQLRVVLPAVQVLAGSEAPVFAIKYAST